MNPFNVFKAAVRAVPQVKYALGVAGIVAVVAIVQAFRLDAKVAIFGSIIIFIGMAALLVFARATKTAPRHFLRPVLFLTWASLVLVVASAFLLFSAVF